ncbi:hypothetical protein V2E24_00935 [Mycoplasmopsis ciconiae]|uniref:Uncharacterized protein n=1 Tax=Mycoplasmopsis ciconiae TaxID=561067 RepID=A0ABU7MM68_9BACT|nr:hypothetical protein [Mycoplasmopsis ciconiae]
MKDFCNNCDKETKISVKKTVTGSQEKQFLRTIFLCSLCDEEIFPEDVNALNAIEYLYKICNYEIDDLKHFSSVIEHR